MTLQEARAHKDHLCDVWDDETGHIGVITAVIRKSNGDIFLMVEGHPLHGPDVVPLDAARTTCQIKD
jgi:hypothetical protein